MNPYLLSEPYFLYVIIGGKKQDQIYYPRLIFSKCIYNNSIANAILDFMNNNNDISRQILSNILYNTIFYDSKIFDSIYRYGEKISIQVFNNLYSKDNFGYTYIDKVFVSRGILPKETNLETRITNVYNFYLFLNYILFCFDFFSDEELRERFRENVDNLIVKRYLISGTEKIDLYDIKPIDYYLFLVSNYHEKYDIFPAFVNYGKYISLKDYMVFCKYNKIKDSFDEQHKALSKYFRHFPFYHLKINLLLHNLRRKNFSYNKAFLCNLSIQKEKKEYYKNILTTFFNNLPKSERKYYLNFSKNLPNENILVFFREDDSNNIENLFSLVCGDYNILFENSFSFWRKNSNSNVNEHGDWFLFFSMEQIHDFHKIFFAT